MKLTIAALLFAPALGDLTNYAVISDDGAFVSPRSTAEADAGGRYSGGDCDASTRIGSTGATDPADCAAFCDAHNGGVGAERCVGFNLNTGSNQCFFFTA